MLTQLISEWLDKQKPFSSGGSFKTNSLESIARKKTMTQLAEEFESLIQDLKISINSETLRVGTSKGMGIDTSIPYVRFFDSRTPRPTKGWSLVLFANENGQSVSLAIGLGVYKGANKRETRKFTDQLLEDPSVSEELRNRLQIGTSGLASGYEAACPVSKTWTKEELTKLSDEKFIQELEKFVSVFDHVLKTYPPLQLETEPSKFTGKWLVQYNPGIWDFESSIADGNREISFRIGNYKEIVQEGDSVVLWRSGSRAGAVAVGHVKEGPEDKVVDDITASYYKNEVDKDVLETRIIISIDKVFDSFIPKADLEADMSSNIIFRAPQSTSPFIVSDAEFDAILQKSGATEQKPSKESIEQLAERLLINANWLETLRTELLTKRQIILQGPPGTGKTFLARELAQQIADGWAVVQFHPSYAYEDFVEGFRPVKHGDSFSYELKPGPLVAIANEAASQPSKTFVLIIDEINRGNLAKIFGELYFLLEYRDTEITMQYRTYGETFTLPPNLLFIGTMNTADRSIASLDMAIRRRFSFVELSTSREPISGLLRKWLEREGLDTRVADAMDHVNSFIADERLKLGHSYFMRKTVFEDLPKIWEFQILPQLREIFFDNEMILESLSYPAVAQAVKIA
jgi:MoxR-like ATPase